MKQLLLLLASVFLAVGASAQVKYYLEVDGLEGSSLASQYEGWSNVDHFIKSVAQDRSSLTGASRRQSKVQFNDIVIGKALDKMSVKLEESVVSGKVHPEAILVVTESRNEIYRIEMTNVMVTSYTITGSDGQWPQEEIHLNFEKVKTTYTVYDERGQEQGKQEYSWDLRGNQR